MVNYDDFIFNIRIDYNHTTNLIICIDYDNMYYDYLIMIDIIVIGPQLSRQFPNTTDYYY